ncbi:MAG: membrane protein insertase YidC [Ruminococcaceae bacterium]|nr:membrane protein insertase YidC [Oscillospiraceae bacterium]
MDTIIHYICLPLGYLMQGCWELVGNYGVAIILFTLAIKILMMPLSVWLQFNSITMVKIQPAINFIKVEYYGDKDRIATEESAMFKKAKYNPFASMIPLIIQIVLLMGVIEIIYAPMTYIMHLPTETLTALSEWSGIEMAGSQFQLRLLERIVDTQAFPTALQGVITEAQFTSMQALGAPFLSLKLTEIPLETWGINTLVPIVTGAAALLMCMAQNAMNPLQAEQSKANKYGMTAFSVGLSLYLGCGVPVGIALYWTASNLLAIVVQVTLNIVNNPKKYIDYDALEKSRKALANIESLGQKKGKKTPEDRANAKRERADYKRFFKVVNKHVVVYAESGGFYKYFEALINHLLDNSNMVIHYVTNDPNDPIFERCKTQPRIKPYYIGIKKLITLMGMLEADMVIMTTPDLDKFYLKRSAVRRDIEYVYIPHGTMSIHMSTREGAFDAFDTIFCPGPHVAAEIRATERVYGLPEKTIVEYGYPLIEKLVAVSAERAKNAEAQPPRERKEILIAPSWQPDNLLDSCIDQLLEQLLRPGYHVTVRPHPEYIKRYGDRMDAIVERYADRVGDELTFELDFSSNTSVYSSDLLITDWSGIFIDFCYATGRPVMFINTKVKSLNPNWEKIGLIPSEIALRTQVGVALEKDELDKTAETADHLISHREEYAQQIKQVLDGFLYKGDYGKTGAVYVLRRIKAIQEAKKKK